mgnify:CR=1 FL=1
MVIKTLKAFTLRNTDTGKLTSFAFGSVATVDNTLGGQLITDGFAVEYTPLVPEGTISIDANGTYEVTQYATASVNVEPSLEMSVVAVTGDVDLLGLIPDDLQEDIEITNNAISGTLKYVTDYTGFSGDVSEQSGNYLALKVTALAGASITVELINGTVGHPVTLDSDGMIVLKIADVDTQSIEVVATKGNISEKQSFTISGLTLEPET